MRDQGRTEGRHQALAELAAGQHGVVSAHQLRSLGYSKHSVSRAATSGRLSRIHRGVYAVGHDRLTWHGRCMAAVLASEPAVASHTTAAWLLGLLRTRPSSFHLTATSRRRAKPRPGQGTSSSGGCADRSARSRTKPAYTVHFARLLDDDIDWVDGVPVTSLARTLLDLAATLSPYRLEKVIERAEELELLDLGPIEYLLARAGNHPGAARLRRALDIYRHDPALIRSGLERRFRKLVRAAGLPAPAMNFNVAGYELDAYWAEHRFAVEIDVFETHSSRAAFERDRLRQEELKLAGVEMTRVTGARIKRDPKGVAVRLEALLAQRRAELARGARG
jgi:predicted transcriptional regulator of viral defense system/very-short-patch-repair endonuclease